MKAIKERINEYLPVLNNLLETKDHVSIPQILELKNLIDDAEKEAQRDDDLQQGMKGEINFLKSSLNSLMESHYNIEDLKLKLKLFLERAENTISHHKAISDQAMRKLRERIRYLEDFIAIVALSIEKLDRWEKLYLEMDIDLLEIYVNYLKLKFPVKDSQHPALIEFLENLKIHSEQDDKEMSTELNTWLKEICQYLYKNPQLFSGLQEGNATYISKEDTHLKFTVQVKNTAEGFELYVGLKCKVENWIRKGSYKTVKKNLMLIKGKWYKGVDAVVYGEKDSKDPNDKINLTNEECKRTQTLDPRYVHKFTPAASYTHKGEYKQSFVSLFADGDLGSIIFDFHVVGQLSIGELYILCYSMAASLAYLHSEPVNLVHQDVRCNNFLIFYDEDGMAWAKIADLGLSNSSITENDKLVDLQRLGSSWQDLLYYYAHFKGSQSSQDKIFVDLYSLCKNLQEDSSTSTGCKDAGSMLKTLDLIFEKLKQVHPSEAGWVKNKIEKFYGIQLETSSSSVKKTERNNVQIFFPRIQIARVENLLKPPSDIYNSL